MMLMTVWMYWASLHIWGYPLPGIWNWEQALIIRTSAIMQIGMTQQGLQIFQFSGDTIFTMKEIPSFPVGPCLHFLWEQKTSDMEMSTLVFSVLYGTLSVVPLYEPVPCVSTFWSAGVDGRHQ